ncbi:hypothetical protein Y1Q_0005215 [Alligator mississippiensis]|uniref:Uncharacterized protein n=1 Tax=Alligator mississippiensis TaxID=8496 RepID=A0A151MT23_ALLMI|nr:hypothetical protein Y1Q_0005215 [Alligator mississippiensis]
MEVQVIWIFLYHYPYFTTGETEAQRNYVTWTAFPFPSGYYKISLLDHNVQGRRLTDTSTNRYTIFAWAMSNTWVRYTTFPAPLQHWSDTKRKGVGKRICFTKNCLVDNT